MHKKTHRTRKPRAPLYFEEKELLFLFVGFGGGFSFGFGGFTCWLFVGLLFGLGGGFSSSGGSFSIGRGGGLSESRSSNYEAESSNESEGLVHKMILWLV